MMAKVQFKKLSDTHQAIMDWIMVNPGGTYQQCASQFGYTPQAICYIVNSDLFRARLAERRGEVEGLIHADIPTKLATVADTATERMMELVNHSNDPDLLVDVWDKALHRLGYGPAKGGNTTIVQQNNANFSVTQDELAQAREVMLQVAAKPALPATPPKVTLVPEDTD